MAMGNNLHGNENDFNSHAWELIRTDDCSVAEFRVLCDTDSWFLIQTGCFTIAWFVYCKPLHFRCVLISRFLGRENFLHFNLHRRRGHWRIQTPQPFPHFPSPPLPFPFPALPFPSLFPLPLLEVGPLNTARGSGERCKLPQRGLAEIELGAF